jgi:predicted aspartyl protease
MIINGTVDNENRLWVTIKVTGYHGGHEIPFRIDTGFDGELSLPISKAVPLGLPLVGESEYSVAGGATNNPLKFSASIQWGSKNKLVSVDVDRTRTPLLGMGLLIDYILVADFKKKTLKITEAKVDNLKPKLLP